MAKRSMEQIADRLEAVGRARPGDSQAVVEALWEAVEAAREQPGNQVLAPLAELLGDLAEEYQAQGRIDEALAVMREAIEAGYRGQPDPQCRIAEILMTGGREGQARPIWVAMAEKYPGDVWVFNNAGLEYQAIGDHETALDWLTRALRIAVRTGDPERLLGQLHSLRAESLQALGRSEDELQSRAQAYMNGGAPVRPGQLPAALRPTTPDGPAGNHAAGPPSGAPAPGVVAFAWFPETEFIRAVERWPHLADRWGQDSFTGYCAATERHVAAAVAGTGGCGVVIAPVEIGRFLDWCRTEGKDPGSGDARAGYAAVLARTDPGSVVSWPPGRNEACWCRSGRKYKKCCGSPAGRMGS
jgi:hypothetical protein